MTMRLIACARVRNAVLTARNIGPRKRDMRLASVALGAWVCSASMNLFAAEGGEVRIITLDPGHFHAALVQKAMYPGVSPVVHVFAPAGEDLDAHLKRISDFNSRSENPTHWDEKVYSGPDFLERMIREKPGNLVVIAGNNTRKTDYIHSSLKAGLNVLADKPMAINPEQFQLLRKAFDTAAQKKLLLYDIMTERFEITTILQRELARSPEVFGTLKSGSATNHAVAMESVHPFFKEVAGKPLGHDVVEEQFLLRGGVEGFAEKLELFGIDRHRFVGEHVETGLERTVDVYRVFCGCFL